MASSTSAQAPISNANLRHVNMVSGQPLQVQGDDEVVWFEATRDKYLDETKFSDATDLRDLDRLLILELMVYRWTVHLASGVDYEGDIADEEQLRKNIKDYCVDERTEILTQRGWATFDQLVPGEAVLTLDHDAGVSEWAPVKDLYVNAGVAGSPIEMVRMESRGHSSLTTPNHRWPVLQRAHREVRESAELTTASRLLLAAPRAEPPAVAKHDDDFVDLVAWWWTEGSAARRDDGTPLHGHIYQSSSANSGCMATIRAALTRLYGPGGSMALAGRQGVRPDVPLWREIDKGFQLSVEVIRELDQAAPDKVLAPQFVLDLTETQLRSLIMTSVAGDGWVSSKGYMRLAQRRLDRIRALEFACALAGIPTRTRFEPVNGMWECALMRPQTVWPISAARQGKGATVERVPYEGIVWCPVGLRNGTWLARRDGTVYWTGNSSQIDSIKKAMGLNKAARDAEANTDSVADYIQNLKARAKAFGIHRETQLRKALELMNELHAIVGAFDRSDQEEREKIGFESEAEILEWIRNTMLPEYTAIDEHFRQHDQRYWVRSL